jgi:hypothetical protein
VVAGTGTEYPQYGPRRAPAGGDVEGDLQLVEVDAVVTGDVVVGHSLLPVVGHTRILATLRARSDTVWCGSIITRHGSVGQG